MFNVIETRKLVGEIFAATSDRREVAAEKISQWITETTELKFAAILGRALESAVSIEDSESAMAAQLNALSDISSFGLLPADAIERVLNGRSWEQPWAVDYIDGLRDDIPIAPK